MEMEQHIQQQLNVAKQAICNIITTLPEAEQAKIEATKRAFFELMNATGDAGQVALVLFQMEYDNSAAPYGDAFKELGQLAANLNA